MTSIGPSVRLIVLIALPLTFCEQLPSLALPTELRCLIATYCTHSSLINLAAAERDWLSPCEYALYSSVRFEVRQHNVETDVPMALSLLRTLATCKRRGPMVKRLSIALSTPVHIQDWAICEACHAPMTNQTCSTKENSKAVPTGKDWRCGQYWTPIPSNVDLSDMAMNTIANYADLACSNYYSRNCMIIWANLWRVLRGLSGLLDLELPAYAPHTSIAHKVLSTLRSHPQQLHVLLLPSEFAFERQKIRPNMSTMLGQLDGSRRLAILSGFSPGINIRAPGPALLSLASNGINVASVRAGHLIVWPALYRPGKETARYIEAMRDFAGRNVVRRIWANVLPHSVPGPADALCVNITLRIDQGDLLPDLIHASTHAPWVAKRVTDLVVHLLPSASSFGEVGWRKIGWQAQEEPENQCPPDRFQLVEKLIPLKGLQKVLIKAPRGVDPGPKWTAVVNGRKWSELKQHGVLVNQVAYQPGGAI